MPRHIAVTAFVEREAHFAGSAFAEKLASRNSASAGRFPRHVRQLTS